MYQTTDLNVWIAAQEITNLYQLLYHMKPAVIFK